jgi:hypothetical protein
MAFDWNAGGERDRLGRPINSLAICAVLQRTIVLHCIPCGRTRYLNGVGIWHLFKRNRWGDCVADIKRHFRCGKCGQRPAVSMSEQEPDDGPQPPMPDEREWKRLKSRYRS